jgi:CRISPR-associated protein Cas5d
LSHPTVSVRVTGEQALFCRPEFHAEPVSYPLPTPSAARGICDAIYWHPGFRWKITEIRSLVRAGTFSILRNEVEIKMSPRADALFADQNRQQRNAVMLRGPLDYIIVAECLVLPGGDPAEKHRDIFRRRVTRGQCHHRPVLGTRECAAEFCAADDAPEPIDWTEDLGLMLWDLEFQAAKGHPHRGGMGPHSPLFFHAKVEDGVMRVPAEPLKGGRP